MKRTRIKRSGGLGLKKGRIARKKPLRGSIRPVQRSSSKRQPKQRDFLNWGLKQADREFSKWIRHRDEKCIRCGATSATDRLQNSHFWGRIRKETRYDPENCDTLCATCHYWGDTKRGIVAWEEEKQGAYMRFKLQQLGAERYAALEARSNLRPQNKEVIERCQKFLATQEYTGKPKYLQELIGSLSSDLTKEEKKRRTG